MNIEKISSPFLLSVLTFYYNESDQYLFMKQSKAPYEIIFEDENVIAVYKKHNVLSVATEDKKTFHHNLQYYIGIYLKKKNEKCYLIHRLDYETSGIMVFAKTLEMKRLFQDAFKNDRIERDYEAVVKENIKSDFTVLQYLKEKGKNVVISDKTDGKEAVTDFKAKNRIQIGTVLSIRIHNGRHNQIRIALQEKGLTLIGDKRYSKNEAKRMYLNSFHLHPLTEELKQYNFYTPPLWLIEE